MSSRNRRQSGTVRDITVGDCLELPEVSAAKVRTARLGRQGLAAGLCLAGHLDGGEPGHVVDETVGDGQDVDQSGVVRLQSRDWHVRNEK